MHPQMDYASENLISAWNQKRSINQCRTARQHGTDLPHLDPTAPSRAEIKRLRQLELTRRSTLQYMKSEDISHEFDLAMKVSIKEDNEAMILKYPDVKVVAHDSAGCPGQTSEEHNGSCLFDVCPCANHVDKPCMVVNGVKGEKVYDDEGRFEWMEEE